MLSCYKSLIVVKYFPSLTKIYIIAFADNLSDLDCSVLTVIPLGRANCLQQQQL